MKKLICLVTVLLLTSLSCEKTSKNITKNETRNVPIPKAQVSDEEMAIYDEIIDSENFSNAIYYKTSEAPHDPNIHCFYPVEVITRKPASTQACFNTKTGEFNWKPGKGDAGTYDIVFSAIDEQGASDSEVVTITIEEKPNEPPKIYVKERKRIKNPSSP